VPRQFVPGRAFYRLRGRLERGLVPAGYRPADTDCITCPSCGTPDMGPYCEHCGEKRRSWHDLSWRHICSELLETLVHFDSKILRSSWALVSRPGQLSVDYFAGRRIRYMAPLRLFLLLSVIYYLSNSIFPYNAFTTPLAVQLQMNNYYPGYAWSQLMQAMAQHGIGYADLAHHYDAKTAILSKTLVFVLIPVYALLFYAFLFHKRRQFAEHLVIATHFWCYALLAIGIFIPLLLWALKGLAGLLGAAPEAMDTDAIATLILQLLFASYLLLMFRRAYGTSWWYGSLLALAFAWAFFDILWLYRLLLFVLTLRML